MDGSVCSQRLGYLSNLARTSATITLLSRARSVKLLCSNRENKFLLSSMARPLISFSTTCSNNIQTAFSIPIETDLFHLERVFQIIQRSLANHMHPASAFSFYSRLIFVLLCLRWANETASLQIYVWVMDHYTQYKCKMNTLLTLSYRCAF